MKLPGDIPNPMTTVLAVVQMPPPYHGQAIMNEVFVTGEYQKIVVHTVQMNFSQSLEAVGKPGLGKVFELGKLIAKIMVARLRLGPCILYYPPASPHLVPVFRDIVLLLSVRWMFHGTVFHFHAGGVGEFLESLASPLKFLARWVYHGVDLGIVLGSFARQDAEILGCRRVKVIPYGIIDQDPPKEEKAAKPPLILFVGMVCREKGVEVLLEALAILAVERFSFRAVIAGRPASSDEFEGLKARSRTLGIADQVDFCGLITGDDKARMFADCDIFCFPTFYSSEALPVVILEAMRAGKPVISTLWRGVADEVVDGETGFLVPPGDSPEVADRLQKLLVDPGLRRTMGEAGRQRFLNNFTIDKFRSRMEAAVSSFFV